MFNNFIYLLLALIIFTTYTPDKNYTFSIIDLLLLFTLYVLFSVLVKYRFKALNVVLKNNDVSIESQIKFHNITTFSMTASLVFFFFSTYLFHLKEVIVLLSQMPGSFFIHEVMGICFYFIFLTIYWKASFLYYRLFFNPSIIQKAYIRSQFAFNIPVFIPWLFINILLILSDFINDLLGINTSRQFEDYILFPLSLVLIAVFFPFFIQKIWNCKPLPDSELQRKLISFCKEKGLKFNNLLVWNIFEGKIFTAGIMGIVARFRYILITPVMLTYLSLQELKSVLAHEIGHYKNHHLIYYLLFFIGFFLITLNYQDILYLFLAYTDVVDISFFFDILKNKSGNFFSLLLTVPLIIFFIFYFRIFFGFISRAFEREADIHCLLTIGDEKGFVSSLEKIGMFMGNIREMPSWHHYSIKKRVDFITQCSTNPVLVTNHKRKVKFIKGSYILFLAGLITLTFFIKNGDLNQHLQSILGEKILLRQITEKGSTFEAHYILGSYYYQNKKYFKAEKHYLMCLKLSKNDAEVLNNLAWLYVTSNIPELQKYDKALELSLNALSIKRAPYILDTVAECHYKLGHYQKAIEMEEEALATATENRHIYEKQLKKFRLKTGYKR